ncbi:hypothetical protein H4W81_004667 [Nonomuraea africana]|uniref:Uncharacterized protein n=1 Tax=Nonomuraea africana TaxID=46171 RepID=A0ABR9KIP5_9ACTN|nr:hypothetical protein [Nonomuraea africana]
MSGDVLLVGAESPGCRRGFRVIRVGLTENQRLGV